MLCGPPASVKADRNSAAHSCGPALVEARRQLHACWALHVTLQAGWGVPRLVTVASVGLITRVWYDSLCLGCRSSTETAGTVGSSAELPKSTASNAVAEVSAAGDQCTLQSWLVVLTIFKLHFSNICRPDDNKCQSNVCQADLCQCCPAFHSSCNAMAASRSLVPVSRAPLQTCPPSHLCSAAAGDANLPSAGQASKTASDLGKKAVNSLPNAPDLSNPKGSKDSSFPTIGKAAKPGNPLAVSVALAFPCICCVAHLMLCAGITSPQGLLLTH